MKNYRWAFAVLFFLIAVLLSAVLMRGCIEEQVKSIAPSASSGVIALSGNSTPKSIPPTEQKATEKRVSAPKQNHASASQKSKKPPAKVPVVSQDDSRREKKMDGRECFSYYRKLLPSVNPLWIEDFCSCAQRELGDAMAKLTTLEQRIEAVKTKAEVCYGVRLNKAAEVQDKRFYQSCMQSAEGPFSSYANVPERRRSGFCSCYVTGISSLGYDANEQTPPEVEVRVRSYCMSAYPATM